MTYGMVSFGSVSDASLNAVLSTFAAFVPLPNFGGANRVDEMFIAIAQAETFLRSLDADLASVDVHTGVPHIIGAFQNSIGSMDSGSLIGSLTSDEGVAATMDTASKEDVIEALAYAWRIASDGSDVYTGGEKTIADMVSAGLADSDYISTDIRRRTTIAKSIVMFSKTPARDYLFSDDAIGAVQWGLIGATAAAALLIGFIAYCAITQVDANSRWNAVCTADGAAKMPLEWRMERCPPPGIQDPGKTFTDAVGKIAWPLAIVAGAYVLIVYGLPKLVTTDWKRKESFG